MHKFLLLDDLDGVPRAYQNICYGFECIHGKRVRPDDLL